jgi:hypothetical protein
MTKPLFLLALALAIPAHAHAQTMGVTPMLALAAPQVDVGPAVGPGTVGPVLVNDCAHKLDELVTGLSAGKSISGVDTVALVGNKALAESPHLPLGGGFNPSGGTASLSAGKVSGKSHVATPGGNTSNDLTFTISKSDGKARLTWKYQGTQYASVVDSCTSGYWTAASASSAIAIKLGPLQDPPR